MQSRRETGGQRLRLILPGGKARASGFFVVALTIQAVQVMTFVGNATDNEMGMGYVLRKEEVLLEPWTNTATLLNSASRHCRLVKSASPAAESEDGGLGGIRTRSIPSRVVCPLPTEPDVRPKVGVEPTTRSIETEPLCPLAYQGPASSAI